MYGVLSIYPNFEYAVTFRKKNEESVQVSIIMYFSLACIHTNLNRASQSVISGSSWATF